MEPKKIKNPTGMLIMHGTVIAVVLYMAWQLVRSYRAGGAEVPLARGKYDAINRAFIDRN